MRSRAGAGAALVTLGLVVGAFPAGAGAGAGSRGRAYEPVFEPGECPPELPADPGVTCGHLVVPEDRSRPHRRQVRIFVARLPSRTTPAAADPAVLLSGGPGDSTDLASYVDHPLRDGRELILLDQRGAGRSEPSLACPEIADDERARLGIDTDDDAVVEDAAAAVAACRDRLEGEGIDLAAYDSAANAADVADLRVALGIDEWNVVGHSYGSRLALTVVRDHPEGIRSVVLSGPYPPNVDQPAGLAREAGSAFEVLFNACAADPVCRSISPDLRATFENLTTRLATNPVVVDAADSRGRPGVVRFDDNLMPLLLFNALYETDLIPVLPTLIEQFARGESYESIATLVLDRSNAAESFSHGMYLSVHCQDEVALSKAGALTPAERRTDYLRAFARAREIERAQCDAWGVSGSPRRERNAVRSRIPTLIVVGEYDPVTPPAYGRLASETLPNSFLVEVPGMGHDVLTKPCPRLVRNEFLDDPTRRPESPCLDELGPPRFGSG